jgi:hypothetical protein
MTQKKKPSKNAQEKEKRASEKRQFVVGSNGQLKKVRKDWEFYHDLILKAYEDVLTETKRFPTQVAIAEKCQLSRNTVAKHIKNLSLANISPRHKLMSDSVLFGISKAGAKGDARAGKLFFQLVHNWNEKLQVDVDGGVKVVRVGVVPRPEQPKKEAEA